MNNSADTATNNSTRFWLWHAGLPALLFAILVLVFETTRVDIAIANRFYDFDAGRWIYGNSWWANALIHRAGRNLIFLILAAATAVWLASWGLGRLRHWRLGSAFLALSIVIVTGTVSLGKDASNIDCPRDLDLYGGAYPYVHVFQDRPDALPRARCFPGGHSSGGFALLAFYFLWRRRSRRLALAGLAVGLGLGGVFAFGQWVRGAHFVSHDVWSAVIAWYGILGFYALLYCSKSKPALWLRRLLGGGDVFHKGVHAVAARTPSL